MKKLTAKEILEIVIENYEVDTFAYGYFTSTKESFDFPIELVGSKEDYILNALGLGAVKEVEQYGGRGQGDTWYSVKHFVDHDVYIRTDGYYQSYNGTEFYSGYGQEVRPKEKKIVVFE